jgi:hypothetical protein
MKKNVKMQNTWKDNDSGVGDSSIFRKGTTYALTVKNLLKLSGRFPQEDEILLLWTLKQCNSFSIILAIIKTYGKIEDLRISSYNISKKIIDSLFELVNNGHVKKLSLYVSDVAKAHFPESFDRLNEVSAGNNNIETHFVWNHSKIALIQTHNNFFVCEGSGNFSMNSKFEQYIIFNNKEVYNFRLSNLMMMIGD